MEIIESIWQDCPQIKSITKRGERSDQRECGGGSFYI